MNKDARGGLPHRVESQLTSDLEALFNQHHAGLLRYLTRYTGDPDEAADAVQEAYLRDSAEMLAHAQEITGSKAGHS